MSSFQFIPAIDLLDGQVVRLYKGRYDDVSHYGTDPADQLQRFIDLGAQLIHLVDLNAARNGDRSANRNVLQQLRAKSSAVQLELGGGIRSLDTLREYMEQGIDRGIIGTAAVKDPGFVAAALQAYGPERVIIGVDALDDTVRVSGWEENSSLCVHDYLQRLLSQGVREVIYTDIARDGALSGPATERLQQILSQFELRLIASAGIASMADLEELRPLAASGLCGVISGKAIYEGRIDVAAAIELCRSF
ncbi:MAG: 1-(5-phosphoribosyl)-5-[(5-phosphoribosylamino)methylideneamino]imidazole-4-carboxamide isomerase [Leptospiraceae bacterium]|nr:1-(5-phosphoribosyl)-5-[(5-phosphoribosylamino)methylideneamino]imidazole-4-carboxamide isomerase [Leptospiraceae bacterium]